MLLCSGGRSSGSCQAGNEGQQPVCLRARTTCLHAPVCAHGCACSPRAPGAGSDNAAAGGGDRPLHLWVASPGLHSPWPDPDAHTQFGRPLCHQHRAGLAVPEQLEGMRGSSGQAEALRARQAGGGGGQQHVTPGIPQLVLVTSCPLPTPPQWARRDMGAGTFRGQNRTHRGWKCLTIYVKKCKKE